MPTFWEGVALHGRQDDLTFNAVFLMPLFFLFIFDKVSVLHGHVVHLRSQKKQRHEKQSHT